MNIFLKIKGSVLTLIFLIGLLFSFIHPAVANIGEVESENSGIRKTEIHDAKSGVQMTGDASWFDKLFDNLKKIKEAFTDKLENAKAWVEDGWKEFKDWFGPKWDGITDWLGDVWEGVKDFFSQEWVQTILKVVGATLVVVGVILLGVWALAAIGIALSVGTIIAAVGFGIAGVVFTFASGETSFWGMVAGGLASGISFFGGLGVLRLLGAFRLIPASGLLRWITLGGLGGVGAVGFTLLHGALHYLFTGDNSLWKQAFTFESLFFNFTLGAVLGPAAARIFGSLGVKQILGRQGNLLATAIARIVRRPVSQVANVLSRIWATVKASTIYSAITAGVTAVLDTIIQWKENGKVDWSQTGKRAAIVFSTTLVIGLGTFAIPKLATMGCACGDEIASSVSKQGKSSTTTKKDTPDLANTKTVKEASAEEVNAWWKDSMGYDQPPYKPGTKVKEIELTESTSFVRVYDGENSTMYGGWMMRAEDIQGLTAKEIQDKFVLPYTPKFITDVKLGEGTVIRTGIVNPLFGHKGGGTQFDLKGQRIGEFGNERPIETVLVNAGDRVIDSANRLIPGKLGVVTGGNSSKLGKNMIEEMGLKRSTKWSGYQAQHIIPSEMKNNPIIQKIGMDFDDASNGIFLRVPDNDISTMSRHRGYHSIYNEVVERALNRMDINQSVESLQKQVYDLQQNLRKLQEKGLPLYPSQGATVELWERKLRQLEN